LLLALYTSARPAALRQARDPEGLPPSLLAPAADCGCRFAPIAAPLRDRTLLRLSAAPYRGAFHAVA